MQRFTDDDWELLELVDREGRRPCSGAYEGRGAANTQELKKIYTQIRLLRAAGCPPEDGKRRPTIEKVLDYEFEAAGGQHSVPVFVLKCKPSHWRLYFYKPSPNARCVVFLFAVKKKTDKRDPADEDRAGRLLGRVLANSIDVGHLPVPDRW